MHDLHLSLLIIKRLLGRSLPVGRGPKSSTKVALFRNLDLLKIKNKIATKLLLFYTAHNVINL